MNRFDYPWFHLKVPKFLEDLFIANGTLLTYKKGDLLADFEEQPKELLYVKSGVAMFSEITEDGNRNACGILLPQSAYGEPVFMDDYYRIYITAIEKMTVLKLPAETIYKDISTNIDHSKIFIKYLLQKYNSIEFYRKDVYASNVLQRFSIFLKSFVIYTDSKVDKNGYYKLSFKITHELLAEILNTTRTSASLVIGYHKKNDLIKLENKYLYFKPQLIEEHVIREELKNISWTDIRNI